MTTPSTKPDDPAGARLGTVVNAIPRTYVVRYSDGHEREITSAGYQIVAAPSGTTDLLEFIDHDADVIATFRGWDSVESKYHDQEHPERGSDVA
jgi:hypothetical protein